jgi:YD repeat-containing protein
MADDSSALANAVFTADDIDAMGENFAGELENAHSTNTRNACITIFHRRDGAQAWRIGCDAEPPLDRRIETFETYLTRSLLVLSHADLPFEGHRPFTFVRKYRTRSDDAVGFGVGAGQSFDMAPLGDSQTFAQVDLVLEDGTRYPYHRTSPGTDYQTAKLETGEYQGSPFSHSTIEWNGGWDLKTRDGWIYRFPASGPGRTWLQSALIGIRLDSGREIAIQRGKVGELRELHGPSGDVIRLEHNARKQIIAAADASGRTLRYEYDNLGRLVHLVDPEFGDEFYEYDAANQLTTVRNAQRQTMLVNEYGHVGQVLSQTLADGRRLRYEYGWSGRDRVSFLRVTLPDGYTIEWNETRYGFIQSWPQRP